MKRVRISPSIGAGLLLALLPACATPTATNDAAAPSVTAAGERQRLLIMGQDLGAIRGYMDSQCCPRPDGTTAYLDFYELLSQENDYGGLGIDGSGQPTGRESSWGAGPVNAYMTATEFGVDALAIGLSITENEHPGGLKRIVAGEYDEQARQLGRFISKVGGTVYLRIGYEFDGAWNQGYQNRSRYVAAYRRIVDVLREQGVTNVRFVWQGSAAGVDEIIDGGHEDIADWYPGDGYVDWVGLSWFMHPDETATVPGYRGATPGELSDELVAFARRRGKPVMIAEASPQAYDLKQRFTAHHSPIWDGASGSRPVTLTDREIWDGWFQPLFNYMAANADAIQALAYINCHWDSQPMWGPPYASGFWGDTRLQTNAEIAKRFTAAIDAWRATR